MGAANVTYITSTSISSDLRSRLQTSLNRKWGHPHGLHTLGPLASLHLTCAGCGQASGDVAAVAMLKDSAFGARLILMIPALIRRFYS